MKDIRNILGLASDADYETVYSAYTNRMKELNKSRNTADGEDLITINEEIEKLGEAWDAFLEEADKKKKSNAGKKRVKKVQNSTTTAKIGRKIIKGLGIAALIAIIIASVFAVNNAFKVFNGKSAKKDDNKRNDSTTSTIESNDYYSNLSGLDYNTIQKLVEENLLDEDTAKALLNSTTTEESSEVLEEEPEVEEKESFADKIKGFFGFETKNDIEESMGVTSETSTETETQEEKESEDSEESKEKESEHEEQNKEETNGKVKFFGDARDDKLVTERATKLVEQLNSAEIINLSTGTYYTVDEIKTLILFMNGAYVPENDAQALGMVDEYLNFCCMDSELTTMIANYNGGEDSFKSEVERLQECTPKISIVDNMLFGNCKGYGYLKWFENKYQEALYTTDRDKIQKIYRELSFSLLYLKEGKGYTIDGVTYTMNDFSGLGNINAGNILQYYAFMFQPLNTVMSDVKETDPNTGVEYTYFTDKNTHESYYKFFNDSVSLDRDNEDEYASYKEGDLLNYYNAICDNETLLSNIAYDDSGYMKLIVSDDEANFSKVLQINTINMALHALYIKDQSYYDELYNNNILSKTR